MIVYYSISMYVCMYVCMYVYIQFSFAYLFYTQRWCVIKPVVSVLILHKIAGTYHCFDASAPLNFFFMLNLSFVAFHTCQFDFQKHENRKENKNKVKIRKMLEKRIRWEYWNGFGNIEIRSKLFVKEQEIFYFIYYACLDMYHPKFMYTRVNNLNFQIL